MKRRKSNRRLEECSLAMRWLPARKLLADYSLLNTAPDNLRHWQMTGGSA